VPTQLKLEDVEVALVELLKSIFSDGAVTVDVMSTKDVNENGDVIVSPPAVRIYYEGEQDDGSRDNQKLTYQVTQVWSIWCGDSDLGSLEDERLGALQMVSKAKNGLAGARMKLADGTKTTPIALSGIAQEQIDPKGVWYSVRIAIGGIAQFDGANANPA
jgi:phage gp37-like protein